MSASNKKITINQALLAYKDIFSNFSDYKNEIIKLRDSISNIDLADDLTNNNFANNYDDLLSDLVSNINSILATKKSNITDDGNLLIRSVDTMTDDYSTEIWYTHLIKNTNNTETRLPSRIVCKYDNMSINSVNDVSIVIAYEFSIGTNIFTINSSKYIALDSDPSVIDEAVTDKLNQEVILIISYIMEHCNGNINIITKYIDDFDRIYMV
jgi:hypothetical protein